MGERLYHAYRVVASGSCFALFGCGSLALALLVFPVARRLPGDERAREERVQRIIHRSLRFFLAVSDALGMTRVTVEGAERLRAPGGHLLVANHPSLLDYVCLAAQLPQLDCVVKKEALANPFFRRAVRAAGYLPNDRGEALVASCAERLREGRSVLLFPEGTRSPASGLGPFHRGAAHVALRSGRPMQPVVLRCDPPTLLRGQPWYHVAPRRIHFHVELSEPIEPKELVREGDSRGVAVRRITAALRDFFEKRLHTPGG